MEYYKNKNITLYYGDAKIELKYIQDNSIDLLPTDPPYGITFMGKTWDIDVPTVETWKECLRVLKPGAFALVMSSPRQDVLSEMIVRLRQAGFNTNFTSIYWTYASGFPKAMNMSKVVDKRFGEEREITGVVNKGSSPLPSNHDGTFADGQKDGIFFKKDIAVCNEAKKLDGSYAGFQPKPAVEVIIVAMKPLSEKSFIDQALKNGKGITWLDDCRIPYVNEEDKESAILGGRITTKDSNSGIGAVVGGINNIEIDKDKWIEEKQIGRFPANLLVLDDILNDGNISISSPVGFENIGWKHSGNTKDEMTKLTYQQSYSDEGSFSRYFDLDKWFEETIKKLPKEVRDVYPFLIVPKAAKSERNDGCENIEPIYNDESRHDKTAIGCNNPRNRSGTAKQNFHPTVKPIKLISYLITLGSREGDIILDPFVGSGTTCLAANLLNRKSIGIEINKDYIEIAKSKISENLKQVRF